MKFQRSAPRVLIVSVAVVVIGMAVLSNRLFSGLTSAVEQDQFELIRALWSFNLTAAENRALERAEMIAALPAVREAFAARDREGLLAQCAEMFKRQNERYGVDQAQFHFPPAISFLRLHAPEQHGDHQDPFRPMVVAVNRDRFSRKETAIAGTGPAIFGVTPMTDAAGQHIGSFELGMSFGPLLHALKAAYRLEMALFIEEQALRQLMFAEGLNPESGHGISELLTEQNRRGKYIKFHSTNWALMKELVGEGDLSGSPEAQYIRSALDVPYGVVLLTLYNNAGDPIGKVAMARDFSSSRAAAGRSLVWQGLLALSGIVLLAGVILIVVRGLLLRPLEMLSQQFVKLAEGRRDQPIAESETLCDEMQALAQAHEQLRTKPQLFSADTDKKVAP
jgi:methyl-accepting chemotaxis protein